MKQRTYILSEDGLILIRHDNNKVNGIDNIEMDLLNFIKALDKTGYINEKKFYNMMKGLHHEIGFKDIADIVINPQNWKGISATNTNKER